MKRISLLLLLLVLYSCKPSHVCITPSEQINIVYFTAKSSITGEDYVVTAIEFERTGDMWTWLSFTPSEGSYPMFMPVVQVNYLDSYVLRNGKTGKTEIDVKDFVAKLFEGAYKLKKKIERPIY